MYADIFYWCFAGKVLARAITILNKSTLQEKIEKEK